MAIRAALLIGDDAAVCDMLRAAFRSLADSVDLCLLAAAGPRPGMLSQLLRNRPDLVVAEASGPHAVAAATYRSLVPQSRLLLCADGQARRYGPLQRLVLGRADGVFTECHNVAWAVARLQIPASRIYAITSTADLDPFLALACSRADDAAHRVIYAGSLSPASGAADLLLCLAAWAEQHPERPVEIWWAGEGDLSGVLEAQPLPDNLRQSFLGDPHPQSFPEIFARCGIMVAPGVDEHDTSLVGEALAAGLVVLGSRRAAALRHLHADGVLDWAFDPSRSAEMFASIDRGLSATTAELNQIREKGRAAMRRAKSGGFAAHVGAAIAAVLPRGAGVATVLP